MKPSSPMLPFFPSILYEGPTECTSEFATTSISSLGVATTLTFRSGPLFLWPQGSGVSCWRRIICPGGRMLYPDLHSTTARARVLLLTPT